LLDSAEILFIVHRYPPTDDYWIAPNNGARCIAMSIGGRLEQSTRLDNYRITTILSTQRLIKTRKIKKLIIIVYWTNYSTTVYRLIYDSTKTRVHTSSSF
jgi:hypothetical protein